VIPSKRFEPDKYWQIEQTGRFNPKVWNRTRRTNKLNIQGLVSTSYLVQKFWIESPCMFNLSVFHVWFKTFVLNHPVCSTCQYLMSGTKLLDTRQVLTNWTNRKIQSKSLQSDKKNKQVEHTGWFHPKVLNQPWRTDNLNIQGDSIQKF
jgi:hypothetical protein